MIKVEVGRFILSANMKPKNNAEVVSLFMANFPTANIDDVKKAVELLKIVYDNKPDNVAKPIGGFKNSNKGLDNGGVTKK